jgi:hypothetical protein
MRVAAKKDSLQREHAAVNLAAPICTMVVALVM